MDAQHLLLPDQPLQQLLGLGPLLLRLPLLQPSLLLLSPRPRPIPSLKPLLLPAPGLDLVHLPHPLLLSQQLLPQLYLLQAQGVA